MDPNSFVEAMRSLWNRVRARAQRGERSDGAMPYSLVDLLKDSLTSTLLCMNHYGRQLQTAVKINATPIATEFMMHAREEEQIAKRLTARIAALGGDLDPFPASVTIDASVPPVPGDSLIELMRENLIAERIAIHGYRDLGLAVAIPDEVTQDLLDDIVTIKERHADGLSDLLAGLVQVGDEEWDPVSGRKPARIPATRLPTSPDSLT